MFILFSFLSSLLLIFPFSSFGTSFWLCAWFGFVPLFFVLQNKSKLKVFWLAYLAGVIFWAGTVYWLVHVTLLGTIVLILYLALYFGIFGLIFSFIAYERSEAQPPLRGRLPFIAKLFFIPSIWVILEYVRTYLFTGFPWALLGYSQFQNLPIIQIADITGVWGVSWLVMMVNVIFYLVVTSHKSQVTSKRKEFLLPILCIIIVLGYGYYKLNLSPMSGAKRSLSEGDAYRLSPIKVSLIQGNIPQELKWNSQAIDFIFNQYKELTLSAAKERPELIIWPEASSPVIFGDDDEFYRNIFSLAPDANAYLLVGAVERKENSYFNAALLINKQGSLSGVYHKLHLVPFGEYIPFRDTFPFLQTIAPIGDIERGKEPVVFKLPITDYQLPITFSVLICFEDLFPELSREFVKRGANFLVNITNDAWYKKSSAPFQHFSASVFRAVENRVNLVRAANTGITGFINPQGKLNILQGSKGGKIFVPGFLTQDISIDKQKPTFYNRYGDVFVVACLLFTIYGVVLIFRRR